MYTWNWKAFCSSINRLGSTSSEALSQLDNSFTKKTTHCWLVVRSSNMIKIWTFERKSKILTRNIYNILTRWNSLRFWRSVIYSDHSDRNRDIEGIGILNIAGTNIKYWSWKENIPFPLHPRYWKVETIPWKVRCVLVLGFQLWKYHISSSLLDKCTSVPDHEVLNQILIPQ